MMEEEEVAEEKVGKCRADGGGGGGESSLSYSQSVRVTVRPSARPSLMSIIPSSL